MISVDVELDNRHAYINTDLETYTALQDFWSFSVPGAYFMEKVKDKLWDGRARLLSRRKMSAGLFRATYVECAEKVGVVFNIREDTIHEEFAAAQPVTDPKYIHQSECVTAMCQAVPRGGGIILAATSAGKTAIAAQLMYRMPERKFLFVVDQLNLLYQAQEEIASWLHCKVGVVGESQFDPSRITVATIQTLRAHQRRKDFVAWMKSMDVVLVDELHEQLAKSTFKVMELIEPLAVFGLTATLELGKKPIRYRAYEFAGPVIFTFTVKQGMDRKVLQQGIVLQLIFDRVDTETWSARDDYEVNVINNSKKHHAAYWITHYLVDTHKRHEVQLVERLTHLHQMSELMHDVPFAVMFGGVDKTDREDAVEAFEDGVLKLLIGNKVMKKGISINIIDAIIDMAETKSKNDAIQKFGRGLRQHESQVPLIYIDFGTVEADERKLKKSEDFKNNLSRASKARARAFRKEKIPFYRIRVSSIKEALLAVQKIVKLQKRGMVDGNNT